MNKIYSTQDYLRINLYYEEDIEDSIGSVKIKYITPDGTTGEWEAVHDSVNKLIYYDLPQGEPLGIPGKWVIWSYATMDDGRVIPGTPCNFIVYAEGGESSTCNVTNCC